MDVGLFNGVLIGILIYNIYLFFATRQRVFFYYVIFILLTIIYQNSYIGYGQKELWFGNNFMQEDGFLLILLLAYMFTLPFGYHYLDIKKNAPKLSRWFLLFGGLFGGVLVFYFTHSTLARELIFPLISLATLFLLVSSIIVSRKGYRPAYYFMAAQLVYVIASVIIGLRQAGVLPANFLGDWIGIAEVFMELFILSFGLSVRIALLREEKEQAQQALIEEQWNRQKILEGKVNERTRELQQALENEQILLQELHHRVKNNMQFITSLYALKLQDRTDEGIEEKLKDVESKIQSMSYVHEMLYAQKNIAHIDAQIYFEKLLETIKAAYHTENITFNVHVKTTLESYQAIYCGIIVNELVINAIKYAFDEKGGEITILLEEEREQKTLDIKDNGKGMAGGFTESFGLLMVKTLVEKQLEGNFSRIDGDGAHWHIEFGKI